MSIKLNICLCYWYFQQNQCLSIKKTCHTIHTKNVFLCVKTAPINCDQEGEISNWPSWHSLCLKGGLWFFVWFRNFFSDNTRVRIFIFFVAQIFFPEFNIRLYDKNSESDYFFFPPPKSEYFFQQHWESEYFF
jgi:hypothetical protein